MPMHPTTDDMLKSLESKAREETNKDARERIYGARRELLALKAIEAQGES